MMTPKEISNHVSIFDSRAWNDRHDARAMREAKRAGTYVDPMDMLRKMAADMNEKYHLLPWYRKMWLRIKLFFKRV